jgi:hypothetical protein
MRGPAASVGAKRSAMTPDHDIVDQLYDHVFGSREPTKTLVEQGRFPGDWTARYLDLLQVATVEWRDQPMWPRKMVAAIHFTSWYLNLRYEVWRHSTGDRNEGTERDLASLRSPSEIFLMHGSLAQSKP